MKKYIYCLSKEGKPFYIGQSKNVEKRSIAHARTYGDFDVSILHECDQSNANALERQEVSKHFKMGHELKNRNLRNSYPSSSETRVHYFFKSSQIFEAFKKYAIENNTSVQKIITESLKKTHPTLYK